MIHAWERNIKGKEPSHGDLFIQKMKEINEKIIWNLPNDMQFRVELNFVLTPPMKRKLPISLLSPCLLACLLSLNPFPVFANEKISVDDFLMKQSYNECSKMFGLPETDKYLFPTEPMFSFCVGNQYGIESTFKLLFCKEATHLSIGHCNNLYQEFRKTSFNESDESDKPLNVMFYEYIQENQ